MATYPTQLNHTDFLYHTVSLLEAAQLLALYPEGRQLAFEVIDFVQESIKEVAEQYKEK